ncbi:MAG: PTS sugar transporter subunit IIA [Bacteroidetes bacterium]|nr:PTS sugar transporter subunit IIA [Bacteroidota bacterium]MCH8523466.1 PTS sugar transporter subunit IIA [Balneolales bacterium]
MKISDLLNENNTIADLSAATKEEAITKLVATMELSAGKELTETSLAAVLEREAVMSTGVGKGLAIPHGRVKGVEENYVAFGRLTSSIEYGSIDQMPVTMIFLLIGPESQSSQHIKLLSRISKLMNNDEFRERVNSCSSSTEIIAAFQQEEA